MKPIHPTIADPSGTGAEYQESDEEEVIAAGDDMEEETQADEVEHQSPSLNKDKLKPSHTLATQESDSDSSIPDLKKFDNTLPLTERQLIKYLRYYEENINHREQTDKLVKATMDLLDKTATNRVNLLNALNGVTKTLKAVQDDADTEEPPSHTEGEHVVMEDDKAKEEPTSEVALIESSLKPPLTDPILEILFPQREEKVIATDDQSVLNKACAYIKKKEQIKKAVEEAKIFEMTKTEVIKVVQEEDEKIRLDPKTIISAKVGKKFKKAHDVEHQVLKREHSQKAKRAIKLKKKRVTELDEARSSIQKKKSTIVKDLMTSLGKIYERLKKIPEERRIQSSLPAPEQAPSESSRRKRKHMELEPKIKIPGLECNISIPKGVPFVNNMVIEEPEYGIFFTDVFGDQAFQRWNAFIKLKWILLCHTL
nr:hypothetical protein [Tanacetum cinerariifolium]GEX40662.1 hypothetical protein [Tanacetum cinerariifolium]